MFRHPGNETYFYFQLHAARPVLEAAGRGSTSKNLQVRILESVALSVPPLDEQSAIATFLDRETAQIDGLVERKERLIELLQEKRAVLITRAVTRGLDPNVSMKDSGVEWLGEIPAHWEVKRTKFAATLRLRAHPQPTEPGVLEGLHHSVVWPRRRMANTRWSGRIRERDIRKDQ